MWRVKGTGPTTEMVTEEGAATLGLGPAPPEWRCPFCGTRLPMRGVVMGGRVFWISHAQCGCPGSVRKREELEVEEARIALESRRERLRRSGIGLRYQDAEPTVPECLRFCESFSRSQGTGLYIHGRVGVGKTHNALGVAAAVSDRGFSVAATTAVALLSSIRATFDDSGTTAAQLKDRFLSCDLMVLDDLGKESATPWSVMTLFEVLNSRYEGMRPTIVTSQYTLAQLENRLSRQGESETGLAIVSRLRQVSVDVALTGPDRRAHAGSPAEPHPGSLLKEGFEALQ